MTARARNELPSLSKPILDFLQTSGNPAPYSPGPSGDRDRRDFGRERGRCEDAVSLGAMEAMIAHCQARPRIDR